MLSDRQTSFRVGPWTVEPLRGVIDGSDGKVQHLEPKVMEVLVLLAHRPGTLVTRERLMEAVWSEHVAADQLLTRAVSELRRALHDNRGRPIYIETVPKRGYRLVADVQPLGERNPAISPADPAAASPSRRRPLAIAFVVSLALAAALLTYDQFRATWTQVGRTTVDDVHRGSTASAISKISIAVLPFVSMSDDAGNEYFADGLSEEIRNLLASMPDAKVIGRTSSFAFKGKDEDLRIIGELLGVKNILEGSVRKSGDRVRITAQLVNASDGSSLWSDTYDRSLIDIFEVQDEVAAAIIDALRLHIGAYPTRGSPTEVAEAYALFLKARSALNIQDAKAAETALLEAVELDPNFAEAYELLAHVYWTETIPELAPAEEQMLMRDAAAKALALDPGLDFARALYLEGDREDYSLTDVLEAQTTVVRKQPNNTQALRTLTWNLQISGYLGESLQAARTLVDLDPLSSMAHVRYAAALSAAGRSSEALASMKAAHQLSAGGLEWFIGEIHLARNEDEKAISFLEAGFRRSGGDRPLWIRELVTGARDPVSGQSHLDEGIPLVLQSVPSDVAESSEQDLNRFYLGFGHLDRYFEIILDSDQDLSMFSEVSYHIWSGTLRRNLGFTAHPRYLELAEAMGFFAVWDERGPPDFCEKTDSSWVCQ
jgi:TolB-like protein/DNA-binding winged helix-turn-helix (wHTH) protein/tetratricopeptide (TPR) repeat protein